MHPNLLDLPREEAVTACHAVRWSTGGCKVIRMPLRQIITVGATDQITSTVVSLCYQPPRGRFRLPSVETQNSQSVDLIIKFFEVHWNSLFTCNAYIAQWRFPGKWFLPVSLERLSNLQCHCYHYWWYEDECCDSILATSSAEYCIRRAKNARNPACHLSVCTGSHIRLFCFSFFFVVLAVLSLATLKNL